MVEIPVIFDLGREWPTEWKFIKECEAAGTARFINLYRPDDQTVVVIYELIETEILV